MSSHSGASSASRARAFFNGLAVGVALTAVLFLWLRYQERVDPETSARLQAASNNAMDVAGEAIYGAAEALQSKLEALDLRPDQVREELAHSGQVVRRRARELADLAVDAAADARMTASIKARFATDRELSGWSISVSTLNGLVTLEGNVPTAEQVAKATALALDVHGVRQVTANLKLTPR